MQRDALLEGTKVLMRACYGLGSDVTDSELVPYASKHLRQVRLGESMEAIRFSLSQTQLKLSPPYSEQATRDLAERLVAMVPKSN